MAVKKLRLDTITTTATQKTHEGWVGRAGQDRQWWMKHHVTQSPSIHSNPYSQLSMRKTFSASFAPQPV